MMVKGLHRPKCSLSLVVYTTNIHILFLPKKINKLDNMLYFILYLNETFNVQIVDN